MRRAIAAAALVAAAGLGACSSGSGSGDAGASASASATTSSSSAPGSGSSSAPSSWVTLATAACDVRATAIQVASAQLTPQSTAEQFKAWFEQFFEPAYRGQLDAMRAAGPPDATARQLIDDTAAVVDAMAKDPAAYAYAPDPFADVDARWDAYGIAACGTRTG